MVAFASVAQTLGFSGKELDLADGATVADLLALLQASHPGLGAHLEHLAVAVDGELGARERILAPGCEVALLPPVSGG